MALNVLPIELSVEREKGPERRLRLPDELVAAALRRRTLQGGSRSAWPRVRLPLLLEHLRRFGDAWPEATWTLKQIMMINSLKGRLND